MTDKAEDKVEDDKVEDQEVVKEEGTEVVEPVLSEVEQSAVTYGWQPKKAWVKDGKAEDEWVPAKQFMRFGELKQQLIAKDKQLSKTEKVMKLMKDHHLKVREEAYNEARRTLLAEKRQALEENDLVRVEIIKDRLEAAKEDFGKRAVLPAEITQAEREVEPVQNTPPPEFFEFKERNPWYRLSNQDELSVEADKIGVAEFQYEVNKAHAEGRQPNIAGVYKAVEIKIRKLFPEKFADRKSPQSEPGNKSSQGKPSATKLTEEELAVAKEFNITPEVYAKQKATYKGRA